MPGYLHFSKKFQDNSDMHLDFKKWLQVFLLNSSFITDFYYFSVDQSWYSGIVSNGYKITIVKDVYQINQ